MPKVMLGYTLDILEIVMIFQQDNVVRSLDIFIFGLPTRQIFDPS
jgi:hypothetical protein